VSKPEIRNPTDGDGAAAPPESETNWKFEFSNSQNQRRTTDFTFSPFASSNLFRIFTPRPSRRSGSNFEFRISRIWAVLLCFVTFTATQYAQAQSAATGLASWYGEEHRGQIMANGQPFDPDKLTAASWSFPLGVKVRVTLASPGEPARSVVVTITDRGPNPKLVREGRIIDLSYAAFKQLASPDLGLVPARVELASVLPSSRENTSELAPEPSTRQTPSG
jgi:rare lipoprotein A